MSQTTGDAEATGRRKRRPGGLLLGTAAIALAIIGLSAGQLTLALFTDQESVDATFSVGSIVLDADQIAALTLSSGAMMPGDSVTDDVVVQNDGSAELRYSISTSSTNDDSKGLRDALTLTVKTIDVTSPESPCDDFDGTTLVSSVLGASTAAVGDPAAGADDGDRTLAAGASETLCFRVSLPLNTSAAFQGAATTTTFTFSAEQTANNP